MYNWCEWTTTWWNYSAAYRNTDMQNHHASPILLVPTEAAKNSSIDMRMHSSLFLLPNWVQLKRQIYNHSSHKKWSKVTMQSLVSLHIFIFIYSKETFETWSYKSYKRTFFLSPISSRHLIIDRDATMKFSQTRPRVIENHLRAKVLLL